MDFLEAKFKDYLVRREADDIEKKINEFHLFMKDEYTKNTISDEVVDFYDLLNGNSFRWTAFARYIQTRYKVDKYKKILDVGCGNMASTSFELIKRGYDVVGMDPKLKELIGLKTISSYFNHMKTDVREYDLLVGLEPCDATEHIIISALRNDKDFAISLCYAPHNSIDGRNFSNYEMWHKHLLSISQEIMMEQAKVLNKTLTIIKRK